MIKFLIKKTFFDMWDNLYLVVLLNAGFVLLLPGFKLLTTSSFTSTPLAGFGLLFIMNVLFSLYCGVVSCYCRAIAEYKKPKLSHFITYLKKTAQSSIIISLIIFFYICLISAAFTVYGGSTHFFSKIALYFIFWINGVFLFSFQFFYPLQAKYGGTWNTLLQKAFSFFIGNIRFSLAVFLGVLVISLLSGLTVFILFGITTIFLWLASAVKLRMYKYDYLAQNPENENKPVNWYRLLKKERNKVGRRTLRSVIYPWKA